MTYHRGSPIITADLNAFLTSVNAIYGVGSGDRGYGQTAISQGAVSVGQVITAQQWLNLRNMIEVCAVHQGTSVGAVLPSAGNFVANAPILAHETSSPTNAISDIDSVITQIDNARLSFDVAGMTLTSGAFTDTRTSAWTSVLDGTYSVTFASENAARYFFNTGGQLRIRCLHPSGTDPRDDSWRNILNTQVGTIGFSAYNVWNLGTNTAPVASLGFYELSTTYQTIYAGFNIGGGAYATNDFSVEARVQNVTGTNGGNGTVIQFRIVFADIGGGSVASGTQVVFDALRATGLAGIANPTITAVDTLN